MVFGWPDSGGSDGSEAERGVWVLRYASDKEVPGDFGRLKFVVSSEEKIEVMREFGAIFVED